MNGRARHLATRILAIVLTASSAVARDRGQSTGTAIWPRATASTNGGPGARLVTACFTNGQPYARREVVPGDALRLTFTAGIVDGCTLVPDESGFGAATDWTCEVDGPDVTLTRTGAPTAWAPGQLACVSVAWTPPPNPASVVFTSRPVVQGSMSPVEPAALPLPGLGGGGAGDGGVGNRLQLASTGPAFADFGEPPAIVPGLDAEIEVSEGSSLLVDVTGHVSNCAGGAGSSNAVLLLDDREVASQNVWWFDGLGGPSPTFSLPWLSDPLPAGRHRVQLGVRLDDFHAVGRSYCMGDSDPGLLTRLTLVELRATR